LVTESITVPDILPVMVDPPPNCALAESIVPNNSISVKNLFISEGIFKLEPKIAQLLQTKWRFIKNSGLYIVNLTLSKQYK